MDAPDATIREAVAVSKFKVEWAKQHIGFVEQIIKHIIADNENVVTIDNDSNPAKVFIGPKQFLPINLPLHLGDAVHNLNSITDYLWTAMARAAGVESLARVFFPRHETRQNLANSVKKAQGADLTIYKTFPKAQSFILDAVNPCKRGDDDPSFIWSLNKLDNINKHRFLLTAAHLIRFENGLKFTGADGGSIDLGTAGINTQGSPLVLGLTPPVQMDHDPKAAVGVIFAEPDHFTGQPVLETLVNLTDAISELIKQFEETFL
jgi:hypothetical protein